MGDNCFRLDSISLDSKDIGRVIRRMPITEASVPARTTSNTGMSSGKMAQLAERGGKRWCTHQVSPSTSTPMCTTREAPSRAGGSSTISMSGPNCLTRASSISPGISSSCQGSRGKASGGGWRDTSMRGKLSACATL